MINAGTFREDLYYRIAVLEIPIPPLRERPTDIPTLIHHRLCIEQQLSGRNRPYQIEPLALKALTFYEWPGNIRELQNIVSRLAARIDTEEPITQQTSYPNYLKKQSTPPTLSFSLLPLVSSTLVKTFTLSLPVFSYSPSTPP